MHRTILMLVIVISSCFTYTCRSLYSPILGLQVLYVYPCTSWIQMESSLAHVHVASHHSFTRSQSPIHTYIHVHTYMYICMTTSMHVHWLILPCSRWVVVFETHSMTGRRVSHYFVSARVELHSSDETDLVRVPRSEVENLSFTPMLSNSIS